MRGVSLLRRASNLDITCGLGYVGGVPRVANQCRFFSTSNVRNSEFPPNSSITPIQINNRNPRNLEKMRIGDKPSGWQLERECRSYWNKVTFDLSSKHITACVVHYLGQKPVVVSTKEWCLKKYLYSTNDASAAKLVGEVLARRCLQAGIMEVACFFPEEDRKKEKVSLFLSAIENGGVSLTEPAQVPIEWRLAHWDKIEAPWEVHEGVDDIISSSAKFRGLNELSRAPKRLKVFQKVNLKFDLKKRLEFLTLRYW